MFVLTETRKNDGHVNSAIAFFKKKEAIDTVIESEDASGDVATLIRQQLETSGEYVSGDTVLSVLKVSFHDS